LTPPSHCFSFSFKSFCSSHAAAAAVVLSTTPTTNAVAAVLQYCCCFAAAAATNGVVDAALHEHMFILEAEERVLSLKKG
jgi:hypothetical protein